MHQDDHLIDAVLNGDQTAFAELVNGYKRMAFNVAHRILWNEEEAEEAAMDAFVKAYRNLKKFDRRSKFSTWFYRIVTNEALGRARKKKLDKVDIEAAFDLGKHDRSSDENQALIQMGIRSLSEKDAELLTLFYLKEFSLEEISELIDAETNTIKVNIHRARKRLAKKMLELLGEEVYVLLED